MKGTSCEDIHLTKCYKTHLKTGRSRRKVLISIHLSKCNMWKCTILLHSMLLQKYKIGLKLDKKYSFSKNSRLQRKGISHNLGKALIRNKLCFIYVMFVISYKPQNSRFLFSSESNSVKNIQEKSSSACHDCCLRPRFLSGQLAEVSADLSESEC